MYNYVIFNAAGATICKTDDRIFASFMNKGLTFWQRLVYWCWA